MTYSSRSPFFFFPYRALMSSWTSSWTTPKRWTRRRTRGKHWVRFVFNLTIVCAKMYFHASMLLSILIFSRILSYKGRILLKGDNITLIQALGWCYWVVRSGLKVEGNMLRWRNWMELPWRVDISFCNLDFNVSCIIRIHGEFYLVVILRRVIYKTWQWRGHKQARKLITIIKVIKFKWHPSCSHLNILVKYHINCAKNIEYTSVSNKEY